MYKNIFTNIHLLFFSPRQFFFNLIVDKKFKPKNLVYLVWALSFITTLLHVFTLNTAVWNNNLSHILVYLVSFLFGLIILYIFRIYFITMIFYKIGIETDYKNIGIIVGIAMISNIVLFLIQIIFNTNGFDNFIEILLTFWNMFLILVGVVELTKISFIRGIFILLIMFGFETMFKYAIIGF
ncbi:MAG: hypothetical protein JXR51_00325 [Bacteroidales bacterium]|nr:hypothetical protein [Bacteroidales bacterium]MBN2755585.1 hypothetical protein [Bacteroidales bacterium]